MVSALLSRCLILSLGTLYPAYRSYKAIKNKDVREYVKWMMYWIVFALFTAVETLLDIFMSWFPFYYEIKIVFILWILSPATRGSSLLYKKVVHPLLCSREKEIDDFIEKTKQQGYAQFLNLFQSGFQYASTILLSSAVKGQWLLESQLKKSFSMNDVSGGASSGVTQKQVAGSVDSTDSGVGMPRNQAQVIYEEDQEWILSEMESDLENRIDEDQQYLIAKRISKTTTISTTRAADTDDDGFRRPPTNDLTDGAGNERRRHSTRRNNTTSSAANYKSNEASHYGTLGRSKKVTKTKSKQDTDQDN